MLDVLEKLLILQDRDRKLMKVREELAHVPQERQQFQSKTAGTQAQLDAAKTRMKQIESDRKKLELDVEAKKQLIEKYGLQQFQTKKNEEYRALAHEIDGCKAAIVKLDDQQIECMERAEKAQLEVAEATKLAAEAKKSMDSLLGSLAAREQNLQKELAELEKTRADLAAAVEESVRDRYERLLKSKGYTVIVGIEHGVCGGCHMTLSRSTVLSCQADQEIVTCTNCSRILYYTRDMDIAVAD